MTKVIIIIILAFLLAFLAWHYSKPASVSSPSSSTSGTMSMPDPPQAPSPPRSVSDPIANAAGRITKKPFGIYVTPQNSPVQPERFTGYHTGTDFETTPAEANVDVNVYAVCDGKILQKRTASGYGGVMVESCTIDNQAVTVVYGHIRASDSTVKVGDQVKAGQKVAVLGTSPTETDGERKHLHLGIHKGTTVNIAGYVQKQADLSNWLDYQKL